MAGACALAPTRAGHDISVNVTINTGGPAIVSYESELHDVMESTPPGWANRRDRLALTLRSKHEIPNRDFILSWRHEDDAITDAHFDHHSGEKTYGQYSGGFFTLMLQPPGRVDETDVRERELIFVLDCSGSMKNFPIEKAKAVMLTALGSMRPGDVFNVVTFNNSSKIGS